MNKTLPLVFAVLFLASCASTDIRQISGSSGTTLNPQKSVYVAIPKGPTSGDYQDVGQYVATALSEKLTDRGIKVTMAYKPASVDAELASAADAKAGYLFVPVLTDWAHNATQWSGNPSTMGVRIEIFNVANSKEIRVDSLTSESSHISFFGTDPKDLLNDTLDDYVDELYPEQ